MSKWAKISCSKPLDQLPAMVGQVGTKCLPKKKKDKRQAPNRRNWILAYFVNFTTIVKHTFKKWTKTEWVEFLQLGACLLAIFGLRKYLVPT